MGKIHLSRLEFLAPTSHQGATRLSRAICISYQSPDGQKFSIQVPDCKDVLGPQRSSMRFWALPRLREIGIERLAILGETDPVIFHDWQDMDLLCREIKLLDDNLASLDFPIECKQEWLQRLQFCFDLLTKTAPPDSTPIFMIG
jgi:hypothetical protein